MTPSTATTATRDIAYRRTWALRIAARRGKQVAVVALARRLTGILFALLRDGSMFEPQRVRPSRRPAAGAVAS